MMNKVKVNGYMFHARVINEIDIKISSGNIVTIDSRLSKRVEVHLIMTESRKVQQ